MNVNIEEATSNTTGSVNIPKNIIDNINNCDIFICDLSTINKDAPSEYRKVQNPNVLIELGFAISTIGWDRILILFNTLYGTFPSDLPFDVDRHRVITFRISSYNDNGGKNSLASTLKDAIKDIIDKSPLKPDEKTKTPPDELKRKRDVHNITRALEIIHIPSIDQFIEELPTTIIGRIYYFRDVYNSIVSGNTFHLFDTELHKTFIKLNEHWHNTLAYSHHYNPGRTNNYIFYMPLDMFPSEQAESDYNRICIERDSMQTIFKELILYIRTNYLEIEINSLSDKAGINYKNFMKE